MRWRNAAQHFSMLAFVLAAGAVLLPPPGGARAAADSYTLTIKDHRFQPETLEIPAGVKIRLRVKNLDSTPEEFESYDLNREKIINGGGEAILFIGPLTPGRYKFFGEFHSKTARGSILVK